jgi:hypothetical protein
MRADHIVTPTGVTWVFGKILGAFNIGFSHIENPYGVYRAGNRDRTAVPGPFWETALSHFKPRLSAKNFKTLDFAEIPAMTPMVGRPHFKVLKREKAGLLPPLIVVISIVDFSVSVPFGSEVIALIVRIFVHSANAKISVFLILIVGAIPTIHRTMKMLCH